MAKTEKLPKISISYYDNDSFLVKPLSDENLNNLRIAKSMVTDLEMERKKGGSTTLGNTRGHSIEVILMVIELLIKTGYYKNFQIRCDYNYTMTGDRQFKAYYLETDIKK